MRGYKIVPKLKFAAQNTPRFLFAPNKNTIQVVRRHSRSVLLSGQSAKHEYHQNSQSKEQLDAVCQTSTTNGEKNETKSPRIGRSFQKVRWQGEIFSPAPLVLSKKYNFLGIFGCLQ